MRTRGKDGQAATEFMVIIAGIMFFLLIFLAGVYFNISMKNAERERQIMRDIALIVKQELELALVAENGYHRSFWLQPSVNGKTYSISLVSGFVYINTTENSLALPLERGTESRIVGSPVLGWNNITKINFTVYLNTQP